MDVQIGLDDVEVTATHVRASSGAVVVPLSLVSVVVTERRNESAKTIGAICGILAIALFLAGQFSPRTQEFAALGFFALLGRRRCLLGVLLHPAVVARIGSSTVQLVIEARGRDAKGVVGLAAAVERAQTALFDRMARVPRAPEPAPSSADRLLGSR